MRFLADGAVGHRPGLEPLDDRFPGFHFVQRDRLVGKFQTQQAAQGRALLQLLVDQRGVFLKDFVIACANGQLQLMDGLRAEQMILAVRAPLILAAGLQSVRLRAAIREGMGMADRRLAGDHIQADAADARRPSG